MKCKRKAFFGNLAIPVEKLSCLAAAAVGQLVLRWIPTAQAEHTAEVCRGGEGPLPAWDM